MSQDHSILRVQSTSPSKDKSQASSLLSIKGDGSIHTQGQIVIEKDLSVDGMARMNGLSIHPKTVSAGTKIHIEIPSNVSYLIISPRNEDNKQITEIVVDINSPDVSKHIGHVLIISNKDQEDVIGDVKIPRSTLAMFVFDGVKYFDIQALKAPIQVRESSICGRCSLDDSAFTMRLPYKPMRRSHDKSIMIDEEYIR